MLFIFDTKKSPIKTNNYYFLTFILLIASEIIDVVPSVCLTENNCFLQLTCGLDMDQPVRMRNLIFPYILLCSKLFFIILCEVVPPR